MNREHINSRRNFLKTSLKAGLITGISASVLPAFGRGWMVSAPQKLPDVIPYAQQALPYGYAALEPAIDAMTMELHYSKHAATYAKNLAEAVATEKVDTAKMPIESLLANISKYSPKMRNNAGGHFNHEFFWKSMGKPGNAQPTGALMQAIQKDFNSFDAFKTQFADAGKNRFGSGWAWLTLTPGKKLVIGSSANQDNPLMDVSELKGMPILALDVWEHAYYLKYQNRRPDYITAWWSVVNWDVVGKRFESQ